MIVLRTPKGWTGPKIVDGKQVEGTWRAHQVPIAGFQEPRASATARRLDAQLPARRAVRRARQVPRGVRGTGSDRASADGHQSARERRRVCCGPCRMPALSQLTRSMWRQPGSVQAEATRVLGRFLRDVMKLNLDSANFRLFGPDETASNRLEAVLRGNRQGMDGGNRAKSMINLSARWPRDGGAERAPVPGLAGRLSAHRTARVLLLL